MKIECILQRKGGTHIELPGKSYHFAPQADGRHVAEVEDEEHIARLLSISEGYRMVRTAAAEVANTPPAAPVLTDPGAGDAPVDAGVLLGSNVHPALFSINGKDYQLGTVVAHAFKESGLTTEEWNGLPDETRHLKIDMVLEALEDGEIQLAALTAPEPVPEPAPAAPTQDVGADERAALVAQFQARFGKSPGNMKTETIKAKLAAE